MIARMLEVQLTSELLIAQLNGMQDKKTSIDTFYTEYDAAFPQMEVHEKRFRVTIDQIIDTFDSTLPETAFRRPPFFYTLYCAVYHRVFGLPRETKLRTPKKRLSTAERANLNDAVHLLSDVIQAAKSKAGYPSKFLRFVNTGLRSTDKIEPRTIRLHVLYHEAFG
jgi:hypothetical protein